jgi:putative transcriptional regulator
VIRCNLKVLLAQRDISTTKLQADTGLSKAQVYLLYSNDVKRVDLDTLETICRYLNVGIADVLELVPDQSA